MNSKRRTYLLAILAVSATTSVVFAQATDAKPDIKSRLGAMMEKLDAARAEHHVPGLGIAVVYHDEVILCDGLGLANIEKNEPATGDHVFAIGSATKAFTAAGIGILMDEGKMSWDDHVSKLLPSFKLKDEEANAKATYRALLSHTTGLGRMDLLWAAGRMPREEIIAAVQRAEPASPFGEFNYCNTNFIAAGHAAGLAYGSDWETLTRERLLKPLKMNGAMLTSAEVAKCTRLATGYQWDPDRETFKIDPLRRIDAAAPAGAIYASPREMANWVRMQLGRGAFEGARIISPERIDEMWTKQVTIAGDYGYALGWMVGSFEGHRLVEHGGNIDGYAAQVAFLPDDDLGYVMLTNVSFTSLQSLANTIVFGTLLEDEQNGEGAGESEDFTPYLGKYVANFGPFKDARFTVQIADGKLAIDVPGQMVYELKPPDETGRRAFAITDTIALQFDRNDSGDVTGLRLFQGGLTFECPREGVTIKPDVSLDDVRDLLGTYHSNQLGVDCTVLVQNGRLAIDVPGQMIYELHPPDDDGVYVFRATDAISIKFNRDDAGDVQSLTMRQAGMEFVLPRVGSPDATQTATLDEVMALKHMAFGGDAIAQMRSLRMTGSVNFTQQGLTGTASIIAQGPSYRNEIDLGLAGKIIVVVAGERGWSASSFERTEELTGRYLEATRWSHPLTIAMDWREQADSVTLEGIRPYDGRPHYAVHAAIGELQETLYVDVETGLVSGEDMMIPVPGLGSLPATAKMSDYRDVAGVKLPFRMELHNQFHGTAIFTFDKVESNVELPADGFAEPPAQVE